MKKLRKEGSIAWKASEDEIEIGKQFAKRYDQAVEIVEELVSATSTTEAPWVPLASADACYRDLTVARTLQEAIQRRLQNPAPPAAKVSARATVKSGEDNVLETLDLSQSLDRKTYKRRLKEEQRRLTELTLGKRFEDHALVVAFEGNDAAGKGGSIRRVVQALDPRMIRVIPIAAPSEEERAQPYLWRFWQHIPRKSHTTIFDRTWYGRVLVERVEGFCAESDWQRAYEEIRGFEQELQNYGVTLVKFWLAIDKDEQMRRFKEREQTGYKRYKITEEDWRNRDKWALYAAAVNDMVDRTSTHNAPWTLVEANDKYFARVKVLQAINDRLEADL
jgi:polyphosphate:AMP phosphotransferase